MQDILEELNIKNIVIADDSDENIYAARQFGETLPGIGFEYFQRGDILVACIPKRYREFDLILTDKQMETDESGFDVIEAGMNYYIPTFIVSGGYQHRENEVIKIFPGMTGVEGSKDSKETWQKILNIIIKSGSDSRETLDIVQLARRAGVEVPCKGPFTSGEHSRSVAESYFRYPERI